jgi:hypothetical protein
MHHQIDPTVKALPYREKHGNIWFRLPKKFTPLTLYASTIYNYIHYILVDDILVDDAYSNVGKEDLNPMATAHISQSTAEDRRARRTSHHQIAPSEQHIGPDTFQHPAPAQPFPLVQRAQQAASTLSTADVLQLQRQIGNRAVAHILQRQPSSAASITMPVSPSIARLPASLPKSNRIALDTDAETDTGALIKQHSGPGAIVQRANKGRKARRARQRQATKGRRNQLRRQKIQEAKTYESYTKTLSEWGSWAWDWGSWAVEKATDIGTEAVTKSIGVNPVEIGTTLISVAKSNLSVKNKLLYLALYGSYQASEYLKDNVDKIVGGEVGEMMKLQSDIDEQLEKSAKLWEQGGITEDDIEDEVKDQIIEYLVGDD